jgi:hypothetical protein
LIEEFARMSRLCRAPTVPTSKFKQPMKGEKMQHGRRIVGYATPEDVAADCLFEAQGDVAEARRLARRYIVGERDYQHVAQLIEAAAERIPIPLDKYL